MIVFRDLLPRLVGNGDIEAVSAQVFGSEAERDLLLEGVGIHADGPAGDEIPSAIERERERFALKAGRLYRQIDFKFASTKSELRRPHVGNARIGETLALAHRDRKHRNR